MTANIIEVPEVLRGAKSLVDAGLWDDAIRLLTEANRQSEDGRFETQLINFRHLAYEHLGASKSVPDWPPKVPDHFANVTALPEISASELSVELVRSAIQHHGSIIVRGLFEPEACELVRGVIDKAFAASEAVAGHKEFEPTPWHTHFVPRKNIGYNFGWFVRSFATYGAGVLAVDSPRALFHYLECLQAIGFDKFLHNYFGERPAISAKKSTLRRTPPDASAGWHQDGVLFPKEVRALNLWAAFSHCGIDAPSIDMFAERFNQCIDKGETGVSHIDAVSDDSVTRYDLSKVVRPVFEPGDAFLFDEMALHRTGVDASMTKTRYAVEMWFFAASAFPRSQVPLYL